MKRIGFIGCGNMGRAMVGGLINSGFSNSSNIIVSTRTEESAKLIKKNIILHAYQWEILIV